MEMPRVRLLQHLPPWSQQEHPDSNISHTQTEPIRNPLGTRGQIYCLKRENVWGIPRGLKTPVTLHEPDVLDADDVLEGAGVCGLESEC